MSVIDNDYHPDDKGLNADQEDHWGTVRTATVGDMVRRGAASKTYDYPDGSSTRYDSDSSGTRRMKLK